MRLWMIVIVYVVCSAGGLLLIKDAFNTHGMGSNPLWQADRLLRLLMDGRFFGGFVLYLSGFVIWLYMLSRNEISLIFPVASGAIYVGLLIGSALWLHEGIGIMRVAGILLILAGILVVSWS